MDSARRPAIAVTAWADGSSAGWAPRIAISRSYIDAVEAAGGAPFALPPLDTAALRALFDAADGVLLTGGGDVAPQRYGEQPMPECGAPDLERDAAELQLAQWAVEENKPLLAICRGHQVLNVALGGTLYQDIPSQLDTPLNHRGSTERGVRGLPVHVLSVAQGSRLADAVGAGDHPANSHHHQAVKELAPELAATGWSEDGVIEALEARSASWVVGLQCHPEEMWRDHGWARAVFEAFVREAAFAAAQSEPRVVGALKPAESR